MRRTAGSSLLFGFSFLAAIILGVCWAVSSPVGSSADDAGHLSTIWCAWGPSDSCLGTSPADYQVPSVVGTTPCFALNSGVDATCIRDDPQLTAPATWLIGHNPPLFYWAMRMFVGDDVETSVLSMRIFNVILAGSLWLLAMAVSCVAVRRSLALTWSIGLVPIGLFFIPSTNPSSWAIISAGLYWAFLCTILRNRRSSPLRSLASWTGLLLCVTVGLGARSDMIYVLAILTCACVLRCGFPIAVLQRRWTIVLALFVLSVASTAYLFATRAGQLTRYFFSGPVFPGDPAGDQPNALVKALLEMPMFWTSFLGGQGFVWSQRNSPADTGETGFAYLGFTFGVGYTDVFMPIAVPMLSAGIISSLLFLASRFTTWRFWTSLGTVAVGLITEIVAIRAVTGFEAFNIQPRYFYPLFLGGLGLALIWPGALPSRIQATLLAIAGVIGSSLALRGVMGRYVHGQSHSFVNLGHGPHWWWDFGPSPNIVWVVGTLASAIMMFGMIRQALLPSVSAPNVPPSSRHTILASGADSGLATRGGLDR